MEWKEFKQMVNELKDAVDEVDDAPELTTIYNTTIEWNRDRQGINFTDREIMDTLNTLFHNGLASQTILNHLEKLC